MHMVIYLPFILLLNHIDLLLCMAILLVVIHIYKLRLPISCKICMYSLMQTYNYVHAC